MVSKRRQFFVGSHLVLPILTAAVMFSTIYCPSTPPFASLKKEVKDGVETWPIPSVAIFF